MSRFVRNSKYRHVYGQSAKKEYGFENVKVTNSAWDTNIISASAKYVSINWNSSGGGAFAILPLPSPFTPLSNNFSSKLADSLPLARSHTAPVLDTDWSPHDDSMVASAGEDGKVCLWKVNGDEFDGWLDEGFVPTDFDPVLRIEASARKIGQVLWHPAAKGVLASAGGDHVVKLWDITSVESPRATLSGHGDAIQSFAFNGTGTLLATTCRDKKLRLFDPRAGTDAVRITDGHGGIKNSRVIWCGDLDRIATTGFSKMSDRQVGIWETGGLSNVKTIVLDQSSGVVMPFWSDNNILFLAGKGDGNIRYYEYENDALYGLSEHKSSDPQRGMCFLPRRALNVNECEIARAYKIHGNCVEPIAFIVPRKADSFQSDIFPPAPSYEPSLSAADFFSGKTVTKKIVDLQTGVSSGFSAQPASSPTPASQPPPLSRTFSAPAPTPAAAPEPAPEPTPKAEPTPSPKIERKPSEAAPAPSPISALPPSSPPSSGDSLQAQKLQDHNASLESELREARAKIRELELKVEALRANSRKAAQALLDQ